MVEYVTGSIFDSSAQTLVNPVNTVGVMGKGLALEFKRRYPEMFMRYRNVCEGAYFIPGRLLLYKAPDHWILLFPTKSHWHNPSYLSYIQAGLEKFCQTYEAKGITSIAFPKLGCGNGGLEWADVKPLMEKYLNPLPIPVYVYE